MNAATTSKARKLKSAILGHDRPEEPLILADEYLQVMQQMGSNFILPQQHKELAPLLERFKDDLPGWVDFVRGIRDDLPKIGKQYHVELQKLMRTLIVRLTQQERRERLDAAVTMAVKKRIIPNDYDSKMQYARRCTQVWKLRRDRLLKAHAGSAETGRLNIDEREEVLADFWNTIALEIQHGEVPKP